MSLNIYSNGHFKPITNSVFNIKGFFVIVDIEKLYSIYAPQARFKVDNDPLIFEDQNCMQWLEINKMEWSSPEIIAIQKDVSNHDWWFHSRVPWKSPSIRPPAALVKTIEK